MVYLHPLALLIAAGYASAGQVTPTPAPALLKRQEAVEPAQAQGIGAFFVTEGSSAGDVFTASSSISAPSLANTQGAAAEGVSEEGASATEGGAESETATETNEENGSEGTAEATESAEQDGEQQKQEEGGGGGDATVLQFAGLLEQLEFVLASLSDGESADLHFQNTILSRSSSGHFYSAMARARYLWRPSEPVSYSRAAHITGSNLPPVSLRLCR